MNSEIIAILKFFINAECIYKFEVYLILCFKGVCNNKELLLLLLLSRNTKYHESPQRFLQNSLRNSSSNMSLTNSYQLHPFITSKGHIAVRFWIILNYNHRSNCLPTNIHKATFKGPRTHIEFLRHVFRHFRAAFDQ